ncbi:MAG: hypothetical protein Q9214_008115, partial [Letrouitia sp. 1 TL-2023]
MLGIASSHRSFRATLVLIASILCFWAFQSSYKASIYDKFLRQSNELAHGSVKNLEKRAAVPFGHHHPRNFSRVRRADDDDDNELTFFQALCKGERLLEMLRTTPITPPPFTSNDWDDNGWNMFVDEETEFVGDYPQLRQYMRARGISVSTEDNLRVEASVDRPFLNKNGEYIDPKDDMPME